MHYHPDRRCTSFFLCFVKIKSCLDESQEAGRQCLLTALTRMEVFSLFRVGGVGMFYLFLSWLRTLSPGSSLVS